MSTLTLSPPRPTPASRAETQVQETPEVVVRLEGLSKAYSDLGNPAVEDFSLSVHRGEIIALLGPSGCGKTTLLRTIAGFESPDSGRIVIDGREVANARRGLQPEKRKIGFVFQDYALFPHLDVTENVAFGLSRLPRKARAERTQEVLDLVGLKIFSRRYPHQLSGGQQQRVALARALAPAPAVILLDEPFSNLDAALRGSTREEVRRILKASGATTIFVTHDQEEAMTFADRIAVMRMGHLEQVGLPETVYLRPRTAFVASFLGTTNLIRGIGRGSVAETLLGPLPVTQPSEGGVLLSLRPEDLAFDDHHGVAVRVESRDFKGHDLTYICRSLGGEAQERFIVQTGPNCPVQVGDETYLMSTGPAVPLEGSSASPV